jgi:hypothetical protein
MPADSHIHHAYCTEGGIGEGVVCGSQHGISVATASDDTSVVVWELDPPSRWATLKGERKNIFPSTSPSDLLSSEVRV